MTEKNKEVIREEDIRLQTIIGITIFTLVVIRIMRNDIIRRPIVNNFYIIDDKIIPFRFR